MNKKQRTNNNELTNIQSIVIDRRRIKQTKYKIKTTNAYIITCIQIVPIDQGIIVPHIPDFHRCLLEYPCFELVFIESRSKERSIWR